jgi:hypothetical protein
MVVVDFPDKLISFEARKKMGSGSLYGERIFGQSRYGQEYTEVSPYQYGIRNYADAFYGENLSFDGIYQMRHGPYGVWSPTKKVPPGRFCVREKFYYPAQTLAQVSNPRRAIFASAVSAWQALSTLQREPYRLKSVGKHMSGYNVFLHEYLISN